MYIIEKIRSICLWNTDVTLTIEAQLHMQDHCDIINKQPMKLDLYGILCRSVCTLYIAHIMSKQIEDSGSEVQSMLLQH